jgi:DNA-binding NarL/FixJ family response regulator
VTVDVVLVEDLQNIQSAMAQMLQGLGDYRIVAALPTEAEAIAWVEQNPGAWGLAVIDLVLEQGSGMGVIARCRRATPAGRIVVFSNFVSPGIRAHCLRLGADAAFDKNSELGAFADFCAELSPLPPRAPSP